MSRHKTIKQALTVSAFAAVTAMCGGDNLEQETQDVIDAQEQASELADEHPTDTAAIRRAGEEVIDEQREAARQLREEVRDKGLDTLTTTSQD
jgi:hypothetical protein